MLRRQIVIIIFVFAILLLQIIDSVDAAATKTSTKISSSLRSNFLRYLKANGGGNDNENPPNIIPSLTYVGEPPKETDPVTLTYGACQGRCTQHSHCQDGLYCIQRSPNDSIISTCLPSSSTNETITNTLRLLNYCAILPDNELVTLVTGNTTNGGDVVTSTTSISQPCQGGCYSDTDCQNLPETNHSLKCSVVAQTSIPGCVGFKDPHINYCYVSDEPVQIDAGNTTTTSVPTLAPVTPVPMSVNNRPDSNNKPLHYVGEPPFTSMLLECQGDCDSDWHCDFGLNCFKRSDATPIPGCRSLEDEEHHDVYSVDYCYKPPPGTLVLVQDVNQTTTTTRANQCEGNCYYDSDCQEGLQCLIRHNYEVVPGCSGLGAYATNYCYNATLEGEENDDLFNNTGDTVAPTSITTTAPIMAPVVTTRPTMTSGVIVTPVPSPTSSTVSPTTNRGGIPITNTSPPSNVPVTNMPSGAPTSSPSDSPITLISTAPTAQPSAGPTESPSQIPSILPTEIPSPSPSESPIGTVFDFPSEQPTVLPSVSPTSAPTSLPSVTPSSYQPSDNPTVTNSESPMSVPSAVPSSSLPSDNPTVIKSEAPTGLPSVSPSSSIPSENPTVTKSETPSNVPSVLPSSFVRSENPTVTKSETPTSALSSSIPSESPTMTKSETPSNVPSVLPSSFVPSENPTLTKSEMPTSAPSVSPSLSLPSENPSETISESPTILPSKDVSSLPSMVPSSILDGNGDRDLPTVAPTIANGKGTPITDSPISSIPTLAPSSSPSEGPSHAPSKEPVSPPSSTPSHSPTSAPSDVLSRVPSVGPSNLPSLTPHSRPSLVPSQYPVIRPSDAPSMAPSNIPTEKPSIGPSSTPSTPPSNIPITSPSNPPSISPSTSPTLVPITSVPITTAPTDKTPITGDETCDDISSEDRASSILQRLTDHFGYENDELVVDTTSSNSTKSFRQLAYDWIVYDDEACPDMTNLLQRFALVVFYYTCGGTEWTTSGDETFLTSSESECDWYGIDCDDNKSIVALHFDNSSVAGTLPAELATLRNVKELNIDSNRIVGSIPSWLDQWTLLEIVDMDNNLLSGSIPSSLYSISTLRVLDLDSNALTGTISDSGLANWIDTLYFLQLDFNQLVGTIPSILGQFPVLQYLSIFGNNFTETILSTIDNLCGEARTIYANCNLCQNSTCCAACLDI